MFSLKGNWRVFSYSLSLAQHLYCAHSRQKNTPRSIHALIQESVNILCSGANGP